MFTGMWEARLFRMAKTMAWQWLFGCEKFLPMYGMQTH